MICHIGVNGHPSLVVVVFRQDLFLALSVAGAKAVTESSPERRPAREIKSCILVLFTCINHGPQAGAQKRSVYQHRDHLCICYVICQAVRHSCFS
jgi:hypothetical protein